MKIRHASASAECARRGARRDWRASAHRESECGGTAPADRFAPRRGCRLRPRVCASATRCRATDTLRSRLPRVTSSSSCGRRIRISLACRLASNVFTSSSSRRGFATSSSNNMLRMPYASTKRVNWIDVASGSAASASVRAAAAPVCETPAACAARHESFRGPAPAPPTIFVAAFGSRKIANGDAAQTFLSCGCDAITRSKTARTCRICSCNVSENSAADSKPRLSARRRSASGSSGTVCVCCSDSICSRCSTRRRKR